MMHFISYRPILLLATGLALGLWVSGMGQLAFGPLALQAQAQEPPPGKVPDVRDPQMELNSIEERLSDQSHAMVDVGYHFANLWFAADKQNWPLAGYYLSETRQHLKWAVRMHPVRKTKAGAEVDLNGLLNAVDTGFLAQVGKTIENKDAAGFQTAYRQTLEGCYSCHQACEKPFLRPQVPISPSVSILSFDPNATGPE
jgi:hypothetical protein